MQELEYELEQDGELLYLEARVVSSGEADYYVVVRDVSDRKWAELALKTQRDFLSAMGDATPSLLAVVGPDGVMSNDPINHTLRELTGLSSRRRREPGVLGADLRAGGRRRGGAGDPHGDRDGQSRLDRDALARPRR